jgi:hypothetical protein
MAALSEIGLMDESMFLCGSDADWCIRAAMRGWEVWYIAEAVCRHVVGVSAKQPSEEFKKLVLDDMDYFVMKCIKNLVPGGCRANNGADNLDDSPPDPAGV